MGLLGVEWKTLFVALRLLAIFRVEHEYVDGYPNEKVVRALLNTFLGIGFAPSTQYKSFRRDIVLADTVSKNPGNDGGARVSWGFCLRLEKWFPFGSRKDESQFESAEIL